MNHSLTCGEITHDIDTILQAIEESEMIVKRKKGGNIEYFNIPCAFDIESTSFTYHGQKAAMMYIWQAGFNGVCTYGRTWEEFTTLMKIISDRLGLGKNRRLVIYVHNLSFEFQFIRKYFEWEKVFAIKALTPMYALTTTGIEFRCSYLLSGTTLAKIGEGLQKYKVEKMVGDLDYSLWRHSKTPLTSKEMGYCINDIRVVMAYIQEKIESDGDITKIPYTKTGYVRQYVRKACMRGNYKVLYNKLMSDLTLQADEYLALKRAFHGGFTHAGARNACKVHENVESADFTSSYPAVMIAEKFPMSKGKKVYVHNMDELKALFKRYCCVFDIEFNNLVPKISTENPLSASKCVRLEEPVLNNGRVAYAKRAITTMTEVDFEIYEQFYDWDSIRVGTIWIYERAYLPKPIIESVLKFYTDKTTLKGVKGKEIEYLLGKELLNSCFGMMVTDIVRDVIEYDDKWAKSKPNLEEEIDKYNNNKQRFLFYPWGVYITSYAMRNLFTGIKECGNDYIYSDTDSVKYTNKENHIAYFDQYNAVITYKLEKTMKHYNLDRNLIRPKTIKGVPKPLGVWDMDDGHYTKFKTLGAKRYMVLEDGKINITVSGVNKKKAVPYLYQTYKTEDDIFRAFDDGLHIPASYTTTNGKIESATGKSTHTYIDEPLDGIMTDYLGNVAEFHTESGVHLEGASYDLSISEVYANFLHREMLVS